MPKDIVDRLSLEVNAVLKLPDVRVQLDKQAFEPSGSTPEELAAFVKEQLELWRRTVLEQGFSPNE